jgi:hydrophobic/amphiphilic exporter-1 (mainly G- bacteria), HAE1 family
MGEKEGENFLKSIIRFSIKNKFALWLMTIIVTFAGLYSGLNMKMETIPNINTPLITVTTLYPGATPEEVAEKVSKPIEQAVETLEGVAVVTSQSFSNASSLQIQYNFEKDMDEAKKEVEEAIENLVLPEEVEEPDVSRLSFTALPIMSLSISSENHDLAQLTDLIETHILPEIEGIDGIAQTQISGQYVEEVVIHFDDEKLAQFGLDQETVQNLIKGAKVNFPLGLYTFTDTQKSVVVDGNITTLEDLKEIKIPVIPSTGEGQQGGMDPGIRMDQGTANTPQTNQGGVMNIPTIELGDIATFEIVGQSESISRTNGETSIGINIVSGPETNTVEAVNAVKDVIKDIEAEYEGLTITPIFDQGEPIEQSVSTMLSKALYGAIFAMLIILLFLRNFRTTIIAVISIPLSLLIAITILNYLDITLNLMTLGAMTVAIGRVIDDSIVVIENIFRRMRLKDEKLKGKELITEATKEMFLPILASTLVTIAVFLPLGLVSGMVGELFLPFALTIVFSLLASLLVAITIVPMLAHSLFKKGVSAKQETSEHAPGKLAKGYKKILNWSLNHKFITSGIAIVLLVGSLFLVPFIGFSFLSSDDQKMIIATYTPEPGQTLEEIDEIVTEAEEIIMSRKGVINYQVAIGGQNPMNPSGSNSALMFVEYDVDTENFIEETDKVIKAFQATTDKGEWKSQDFTGMGSGLSIQVFGEDLETIEPIVEQVRDILDAHDELANVDTSLSEAYEEYTLVANHEKLSQLGLTAAQVGLTLAGEGQREVLTKVEQDGKELNVYIEVEKNTSYKNIDELLKTTITSPLGMEIPIGELVTVEKGTTADTITRQDGKIYADVSADILVDDVSKVSADIQKEIDKLELPPTVEVNMGGVTEDIKESFTQLGLAMLAAIAIVYLIMVITFGGGLAPFAILFSLPFTIIGAFLGLFIAGETISVSAMIGALMLIGIVVTNAIVLIDRVIHKENEGLSTREALLEAGATRLRPILMTALATIAALAPLAVGMEGGGMISKGLGITVIGGLTSSTLLTLIVVPIVYEVLMKFKRKKKIEQ